MQISGFVHQQQVGAQASYYGAQASTPSVQMHTGAAYYAQQHPQHAQHAQQRAVFSGGAPHGLPLSATGHHPGGYLTDQYGRVIQHPSMTGHQMAGSSFQQHMGMGLHGQGQQQLFPGQQQTVQQMTKKKKSSSKRPGKRERAAMAAEAARLKALQEAGSGELKMSSAM